MRSAHMSEYGKVLATENSTYHKPYEEYRRAHLSDIEVQYREGDTPGKSGEPTNRGRGGLV